MRDSDYLALSGTGPQPAAISRWSTRRTNFVDEAGHVVKYRGCTGFMLLRDMLRGFDRTTFVRWARAKGSTHIRVFGMKGQRGPLPVLDPRRYGGDQFYAAVRECGRWLGSEGMGLHFVCATDQIPEAGILFEPSALVRHHANCMEALAPIPGTIFEDINEWDFNGRIIFPSGTPAGLLRTRSSWLDGRTPADVGSLLGCTTEHTPRGIEWERKAKNLYETSRGGIGAYPPTGSPPIGGEPEQLEVATAQQYADYTALGELLGGGTCLHSAGAALQQCEIPADESVPNAVAAVRSDAPPPNLADEGTYTRGGPDAPVPCPIAHDDVLALRTFAMITPDARHATVIPVSRKPGWSLQPVDGWRVTRTYGYQGNCVDLER
jgi:hypothetical protein